MFLFSIRFRVGISCVSSFALRCFDFIFSFYVFFLSRIVGKRIATFHHPLCVCVCVTTIFT